MAKQTLNNLDTMGVQRGKLNDNFTELYDKASNTAVVIKSASDFPAAVSNVITLPDDGVTYIIDGSIDIGANRFNATGDGIHFRGLNLQSSSITTSNPNAFITCSSSIIIEDLILISFGLNGLLANDSSIDTIILSRVTFIGMDSCVTAADFKNLIVDYCSFINAGNGVSLSGNILNAAISGCQFEDVTGYLIDLDGCLSKAWSITNNIGIMTASSTFLNVQVDSGNIISGGSGTVLGNKLDNTLNGALYTGYNPFDEGWYMFGNVGIPDSDRAQPTGFGFYVDDISSTISVTSSPTEITIDGADAQSNSDYLPKGYKATNLELWDTSTNRISPAVVGDSFVVRLQVTINSVSGNPKSINCQLDIGADVTPTIIIAVDSKALRSSSYPQAYTFTFPVFSLQTFVTNGGKFYLETDTGTAVIGFRSILIERNSTGAQ